MAYPYPHPDSDPSTAVHSARSSFTHIEPHHIPDNSENLEKLKQSRLRIEKITSRGEQSIEAYGGDDIHDPPPKSKETSTPVEEEVDPNLVSWDSDNDPTNPQNWSFRYKAFITGVVILMTLNVYVNHRIIKLYY